MSTPFAALAHPDSGGRPRLDCRRLPWTFFPCRFNGAYRRTDRFLSNRRAFCKIRQGAGSLAGKGCAPGSAGVPPAKTQKEKGLGLRPRERGRPARTRPGRVVAFGFTGLVGSPAGQRRENAFAKNAGGTPALPGGILLGGLGGTDPGNPVQGPPLPGRQKGAVAAALPGRPAVVDHPVGQEGVLSR